MIKYYEGTVFNVNTQAVVNTVNCIGVMGAGIALEFALRYPKMSEEYEDKCKNKIINVGHVDYFKAADGKVIVNFPTKWYFKYPSKMIWIEDGLKDFVKTYKQHGITSVAFPKLGTNNGGLNWNDVKQVMEKYLSNLEIDVHVCLDNLKEAEGTEKDMLHEFNSMTINQISEIVKLNAKQKTNIEKHMPYKRFWKIGETESIGAKTYSTLFKYFYKHATNGTSAPKQISIFEI